MAQDETSESGGSAGQPVERSSILGHPVALETGEKGEKAPKGKNRRGNGLKSWGKPFKPGEGGRPKGVQNHFTRDIKEATMMAVERHGGLEEFIFKRPKLAEGLLERMAPTKQESDQRITVRVEIGTAEPPATEPTE